MLSIYQQPTLAQGEQVLAALTLIKKLPEPLRRVIGDVSDKDRVLLGLDLRPIGREEGGTSERKLSLESHEQAGEGR